jgi:hypothetical protein
MGLLFSTSRPKAWQTWHESTLAGTRMAAKAGKSRRALRNMAAFAERAYMAIGLRHAQHPPPGGFIQTSKCANAAVKAKGTIFEIVYRRLVSRLGHKQTIGAIAHRFCRLIWIILHQGVRYEERGPSVSTKSRRQRTTRMIRELRSLGYRVEPVGTAA